VALGATAPGAGAADAVLWAPGMLVGIEAPAAAPTMERAIAGMAMAMAMRGGRGVPGRGVGPVIAVLGERGNHGA
jgi:hypothetical protein